MSASLTFDGRVHCEFHPDVALAHIPTLHGPVCVVCRAERAAQLEAVLNAGKAFEWPVEGRVLCYVATDAAARDHDG